MNTSNRLDLCQRWLLLIAVGAVSLSLACSSDSGNKGDVSTDQPSDQTGDSNPSDLGDTNPVDVQMDADTNADMDTDTAADVPTDALDAMDLSPPPALVPGVFSIESTFAIGAAAPTRATRMDPMLTGDALAALQDMVATPGAWTAAALFSNNAYDTFSGPEQALLTAAIETVVDDALDEYMPGYAARRDQVAVDMGSVLDVMQVGGALEVVSGPDNGTLADTQTHQYLALTFEWGLPCIDDPNAVCDPVTQNLRTLVGNSFSSSANWSGNVDGDQLTITPHDLPFPTLAIVRPYVYSFVLPELTDDPLVTHPNSYLDLILVGAMVQHYNGTPAGLAAPVTVDPGNPCVASSFALSRLIVAEEPSLDVGAIETASLAACTDAGNFVDGIHTNISRLVDVEDEMRIGTSSCTMVDSDADGEVDQLGQVGPPEMRCDWQITMSWGGDTMTPLVGGFQGLLSTL